MKQFTVKGADGTVTTIRNLRRFCKEHGFDDYAYYRLLSGLVYAGWQAQRIGERTKRVTKTQKRQAKEQSLASLAEQLKAKPQEPESLQSAVIARDERLAKAQATGEYYRALSQAYYLPQTKIPERPKHLGDR